MILPLILIPTKYSLHGIKLFEIYNKEYLDKLINSNLLNNEYWEGFENEKDQLEKYRDITYSSGIVSVTYRRCKDYSFGRVYPNHSLSLCAIRREIRHTIAKDLYTDIDISNAHAEIIYQTLKYHKKDCNILEEYVLNREVKLKEIIDKYNVTREQAKNLFIILLYFGSFKTWLKLVKLPEDTRQTGYIYKFTKERNIYGDLIEQENPNISLEIKQSKVKKNIFDYNEKASIVSIWCQEIEQRILYEIYKYCKLKNYIDNENIGILCFDGIMIKKTKYTSNILEDFSKIINEKLGYKLTFVNKELNEGYNMQLLTLDSGIENDNYDFESENEEEHDEEEHDEDYIKFKKNNEIQNNIEILKIKQQDKDFLKSLELISHKKCAEIFYNINPNKYIYSDILGWLKYNKYNVLECSGKGLPSDIKISISQTLHDYLLPIKSRIKPNSLNYIKNIKNINKLIKDCGNSKFVSGIVEYLQEMYICSDIDIKIDNDPKLFAFEDKVFDLSIFDVRDIKTNDYISKTTRYKYAESKQEIRSKIIELLKSIFMLDEKDKEGEKVFNYYLITKSHSLFGNKLEACYIDMGSGGNGKGTLISGIEKNAFGDYIYFTENSFLTSQFRQGSPNPTLADCKGIRQLIISEPSEENENGQETSLNTPFLKLITGNDEITTRKLHGHNFSFKPLFTPFIQTNSAPNIKKLDKGIMRRIKMIMFPFTFVDNPTCKNHKKKDNYLKTVLETIDYAREYLLLLLEVIKNNKDINNINIPILVSQNTSEYFDDNNPTIDFINDHIEISDDNIKCIDLYNYYQDLYSEKISLKSFIKSMINNGFEVKKIHGLRVFKNIVFVQNKQNN